MPELPEVETTKTSLAPLLTQQVADVKVFQPKLRWAMPDDLDKLVGFTLDKVERRAKYLILSFSSSRFNANRNTAKAATLETRQLLIHLGMSGSLQQHSYGTDKRKHDHLIIVFNDVDNTPSQLHYYDPRRFGSVLWYKDYGTKLLDHLGPEPLSDNFTADYLYQLIQRTNLPTKKQPITRPIKSIIMEQQVVVGVGNIYATESLYLSAIHPATPAHQLSYDQIVVLVDHIKVILQKAIILGGSTLKDFTVASGQTGYFQQTLNVYGRQGKACPTCNTILDNIKLNGRASVFCPSCQPSM
ncbi:MAG: bifunctional DNA-formamidopyrimidine glycosylase/DNA-(apurinic or apyrimidinic site) lyase [Psychrobacter sp.]|uniref:bifunctional DNA-formamidopyrimidine glycosylase/DNA-(apurinic or apyrimidinic site) lyase n=1 Tax=unclassified Psychrobacter TaxID=196806 RepID=UPI0017889171|nr:MULTISPECIES: bifunctional DNA-formamidopyrimidine glycosylase/DNA-(apurinic or apyrimidinic site) lyase [unclassified Psychrobacter]MBE0442423.1 bifunctional DNA-formamidopyrimidine glycosylase/DNA-(apurinic or apyrimidinic site) lyase [Psychrobacter sp. FME13]